MRKNTKIGEYFLLEGKGKKANRLEREALEDPFLYEALEGWEQVEGKHEEIVRQLQGRIQARVKRKQNLTILLFSGIAAACILTGIACWMLFAPKDTVPAMQMAAYKTDTINNFIVGGIVGAEIDGLVGKSSVKQKIRLRSSREKADVETDTVMEDKAAGLPEVASLQKKFCKNNQEKQAANAVSDDRFPGVDGVRQLQADYRRRQVPLLNIPEEGKRRIVLTVDSAVVNEVTGTRAGNAEKKEKKDRSALTEGKRDFAKYVADSLRYPEDARLLHIEGEVVLGVHLNKKGRPSRIKILQKLSRSCDREAIRLVEEFKGDWRAESRNFSITISFRLNGRDN